MINGLKSTLIRPQIIETLAANNSTGKNVILWTHTNSGKLCFVQPDADETHGYKLVVNKDTLELPDGKRSKLWAIKEARRLFPQDHAENWLLPNGLFTEFLEQALSWDFNELKAEALRLAARVEELTGEAYELQHA